MEEQPIFIRVLGNSPKIRILNYLIKVRGMDFSMSDIARNSGVGWATLNRLWAGFVDTRVVAMTRIVGRAKLYKLNEENTAVKDLIEMYKKLLVQETEGEFKKQKMEIVCDAKKIRQL